MPHRLRPLPPGGADAVQGLSYQANERDPERHQSPEAVRLGELLQRKSPRHSGEGAQRDAQDRLPGRSVHHGLDQCPLHGRGSVQMSESGQELGVS